MAWNDSQNGQNLQQAFDNLLDCYNRALPAHLDSLALLTVRPITG